MKHYKNINGARRKQRKEEEKKHQMLVLCIHPTLYHSATSAVGSPSQSLFVINLGDIVVLVLWKTLFKSRR